MSSHRKKPFGGVSNFFFLAIIIVLLLTFFYGLCGFRHYPWWLRFPLKAVILAGGLFVTLLLIQAMDHLAPDSDDSSGRCPHCGSAVEVPDPWFLSIFMPSTSGSLPRTVACSVCGHEGCWCCCHGHGTETRQKPVFNSRSDGTMAISNWMTYTEAAEFRHHECCDCKYGQHGKRYLARRKKLAREGSAEPWWANYLPPDEA